MQIFFELMALVAVLDALFEADGDEDAEDDDEEVDEEFALRHGSVMGRVDVDHAGSVRSIGLRWTGWNRLCF
jgi:hypothetical protein